MTSASVDTPHTRLEPRDHPRAPAILVVVVTLLAAALRIPTLGQQSYWFDEGRTVEVILHASFTGVIHNVYTGETTPDLYYLCAWLWSQVVGYGEFGLRFLSAFAGIATIPITFLIGRKLSSNRAGVMASALAAFSPMLVWYSQEARSYSLMVLLTAVSFLAFISVLDAPRTRHLVLWMVSSGLALSTHYYTALSIVPEAIWLLYRYRHKQGIWWTVAIVAAWQAALLPQELHQAKLLPGGGWIATIPLGTRLPIVLVQQLLGPSRILTPLLLIIDLLVVALAVGAAHRRMNVLRDAMPALVITACGAAIFGLSIASGHDLLDPRNVLAVWTPLTVALAIGLASVQPSWLGVTAVVTMCAAGAATAIADETTERLQRPAWRSVARAIEKQPAQAVYEAYGCQSVPLTLYLPSVVDNGTTVSVTSLDLVTTPPQPTNYDVLMKNWYTVCTDFAAPIRPPATIDGLRLADKAQHFGQFTLWRYVSSTPRSISYSSLTHAGIGTTGILMSVVSSGAASPLS